ncbi:N/A [soil metagenome]
MGAGPAGIRAAQTLLAHGLRPILIDEASRGGGQIYRRPPDVFHRSAQSLYGTEASRALSVHEAMDAMQGRIDYRPDTLVWNAQGGSLDLLHAATNVSSSVPYRRLIVATGATDRVLPVPGWTLPGVYTLGGAQVALKFQGCAIGERVVLMGTGPLLYLVAYQYAKAGANVVAVLDTARFADQLAAVPAMLTQPAVFAKGVYYVGWLRAHGVALHRGVRLVGIEGAMPERFGVGLRQAQPERDGAGFDKLSPNGGDGVPSPPPTHPEPVEGPVDAQHGFDKLSPNGNGVATSIPPPAHPEPVEGPVHVVAVVFEANGQEHCIECDAVGFGYALRSETQLADLLGCRFVYAPLQRAHLPERDAAGRSSVAGVYLAGDGAGIMGADAAEWAGERAALALLADEGIAIDMARAAQLEQRLERLGTFRQGLERAFPFPEDWAAKAPDELIVCRCENISAGELRQVVRETGTDEINRLKALSRIGMGRCQGRMCGVAAAELLAHASGKPIEFVGRLRGQAPIKPIPMAMTVAGDLAGHHGSARNEQTHNEQKPELQNAEARPPA